jgi:hypothetical protein
MLPKKTSLAILTFSGLVLLLNLKSRTSVCGHSGGGFSAASVRSG